MADPIPNPGGGALILSAVGDGSILDDNVVSGPQPTTTQHQTGELMAGVVDTFTGILTDVADASVKVLDKYQEVERAYENANNENVNVVRDDAGTGSVPRDTNSDVNDGFKIGGIQGSALILFLLLFLILQRK